MAVEATKALAKSEPAKALSKTDELRSVLGLMEPQFKKALPTQISVEKFVRIVMTAVQINPLLVEADRSSFFAAAMRAAQDGLLPDGKEAALVIYKNKQGQRIVQYMPMVGGILKKVRNSGELASITAQMVHQNDKFKYWVDDSGAHLEHIPLVFGERGPEIGVYAIAKTKDGAIYIEVMSEQQVMDVKNVSRAKDSGPWSGDFATEMWRKSVIRRLSKVLPMSTDLESVMHADDALYDFTPPTKEEKKVSSSPDKPKRLAGIIEAQVTPPQTTPVPEPAAGPEMSEEEMREIVDE